MFYEPEKRDKALLPHDPFKAIVAPRPIGWITSMSAKGEINLAPYSFFNGVNSRPNLVMFASEGIKDSVAFIEETGEFVCSLATYDLRHEIDCHVVFGQVVGVYIDDRFIVDGLLDTAAMQPIARCGYDQYATVNSVFAMQRPSK